MSLKITRRSAYARLYLQCTVEADRVTDPLLKDPHVKEAQAKRERIVHEVVQRCRRGAIRNPRRTAFVLNEACDRQVEVVSENAFNLAYALGRAEGIASGPVKSSDEF